MASRGENAALQGFEGLELWGLVRTLGFTFFYIGSGFWHFGRRGFGMGPS